VPAALLGGFMACYRFQDLGSGISGFGFGANSRTVLQHASFRYNQDVHAGHVMRRVMCDV